MMSDQEPRPAPAVQAKEDLDTLRKMRELLDSPEHWVQMVYAARSVAGVATACEVDKANSFCLMGAAMSVRGFSLDGGIPEMGDTATALGSVTDRLCRETGGLYVTEWNDEPGRTHRDVVEVLDSAIEKARKDAEEDCNE